MHYLNKNRTGCAMYNRFQKFLKLYITLVMGFVALATFVNAPTAVAILGNVERVLSLGVLPLGLHAGYVLSALIVLAIAAIYTKGYESLGGYILGLVALIVVFSQYWLYGFNLPIGVEAERSTDRGTVFVLLTLAAFSGGGIALFSLRSAFFGCNVALLFHRRRLDH